MGRACPLLSSAQGHCLGFGSFYWRYFNCGRFPSIPEELEFLEGMLDFLEQSSITPGSKGRMKAMSPDGTATVEIDGRTIGVGAFATDRILVAG